MIPYRLHLPLPTGWVELSDAEGTALSAWARRRADELAAGQSPHLRAVLAAHLEDVAQDSRTRAPLAAAAFTGLPAGPVSVVLEVWQLEPDDGRPLRPRDLAEQQRSGGTDLLLELDVTEVELPVGAAVRVHRVLHGAADPDLRAAVVEELTYLVLPADTPGEGLVVTASWVDLADGEEHLLAVDSLVRGLGVEVSREQA